MEVRSVAERFSLIEPIIIVGAPRSGTKMLRELLKLHALVVGALYEKERIWCHGNKDKTGMALHSRDLTPNIKRHIRDYFHKQASKNRGKRIVDKSAANSLRLEFVRELFPSSPIIHIVRDGRDASCSIRERWRSPLDIRYIFKNKTFPVEELPYFMKRQLKRYFEKLLRGREHVRTWGPMFDDMEDLLNTYSMLEVCGIQWKRCTESALAGLEKLEPGTFIQVKYEDVVSDPVKIMEQIRKFLNLTVSDHFLVRCSDYVNSSSVGSWRNHLTSDESGLLMKHIQDTLLRLGYLIEG